MAGGTGDGKEVPDEMAVPCFGDKKNHADRVGNAAADQPEQAIERQVLAQGADNQYDHPAHSQIED